MQLVQLGFILGVTILAALAWVLPGHSQPLHEGHAMQYQLNQLKRLIDTYDAANDTAAHNIDGHTLKLADVLLATIWHIQALQTRIETLESGIEKLKNPGDSRSDDYRQLAMLKAQSRRKDLGFEESSSLFERQMDISSSIKQKDIMPHLRPATPNDYAAWLRGYIRHSGGVTTHTYNYNLPADFYVATSDFSMVPLYGSQSINIIVPTGVKFFGGELGHCNIYLMDSFSSYGSFVPMYKNIHINE